MPDGTYAIALHVANEPELRGLARRLEDARIPHNLIVESDEPYSGQAMAIGVQPCDRRRLKPLLSRFALVAQSGRASGVMTPKVSGSNPAERTKPHARSSEGERTE